MFIKTIKELQEMPIAFNIISKWFRENLDPNNNLVGEFLKLNEVFPIGKARDQAYIELMEKKIEEVGLTKKYKMEVERLADCAMLLLADHAAFVESVVKYHNSVAEHFEKIVDEATFQQFVKVFDNTSHIVL